MGLSRLQSFLKFLFILCGVFLIAPRTIKKNFHNTKILLTVLRIEESHGSYIHYLDTGQSSVLILPLKTKLDEIRIDTKIKGRVFVKTTKNGIYISKLFVESIDGHRVGPYWLLSNINSHFGFDEVHPFDMQYNQSDYFIF